MGGWNTYIKGFCEPVFTSGVPGGEDPDARRSDRQATDPGIGASFGTPIFATAFHGSTTHHNT